MDGLLLIAKEYREMVMEKISANYEKSYEAMGIRKNGEMYPIRLEAKTIPYKGKQVRVVEFRDITKQKETEQELINALKKAKESDQLKSAFLANMSHEIRTPMSGILGFTELLKDPDLSGKDRNKFIDIIKKSGDRLLDTVNDIIDISKIDSGQMELSKDMIDINKLISSLYEFFKEEANLKGLKIKLINTIPKHNSQLVTDKNKLNSIISNLIKNAIKHTDSGSIEIYCNKNEQDFTFKIVDTGIGISKDRIKSIFNRFEQADIKDTHAREGSGLGLSISKAYLTMLGGSISVESKAGEGSMFYFSIPWKRNHYTSKEEKMKESKNIKCKNKINLLIAEDDDSSFEYLKIILKDGTNQVFRAKNGKEAVEHLKNNNTIDFVLMDIKMPIMNGFQATKEIRTFDKDIIIIAQTAYALESDKDKILDSGFNDYITKPINKALLGEIINKYQI